MISIVIPTRNGMDTLPGVLAAIAAQRIDEPVEIVAIDTASTDGTPALLQRHATTVLHVAQGGFNHGASRNEAIAHTRGELVVLLSQDAEPANDQWLVNLVAPLQQHADVAGAFARQQVRASATALARHYHANWFGSSNVSRTSRIDDGAAFDRLPPLQRMRHCTFDNVCSCIRKDVWTRIPFRTTPIAEDLEWSLEVQRAGHAVTFAADAVVLHSHERTATYEFKRTALLHQRLYELFGVRTIPTVSALMRAVISTAGLHARCLREAEPQIPRESVARAAALALAWPLGQYVGGRRGARGLPPLQTSDV